MQGEEYAAAAIPEKVKHRIEKQDIMLILVTGERNHDWLISEIGYGSAKSRHIVVMQEKRSSFNPTILGKDFEHIPLEIDRVDIALTALLQELKMVGIKGLFN